jgi:hypothetical protein
MLTVRPPHLRRVSAMKTRERWSLTIHIRERRHARRASDDRDRDQNGNDDGDDDRDQHGVHYSLEML